MSSEVFRSNVSLTPSAGIYTHKCEIEHPKDKFLDTLNLADSKKDSRPSCRLSRVVVDVGSGRERHLDISRLLMKIVDTASAVRVTVMQAGSCMNCAYGRRLSSLGSESGSGDARVPLKA